MTNRTAESMGTYGSTWEAAGYAGAGSVGSLINTLQGRPSIVCGSGETVFYELEDALKKLGGDAVIFGVNDVGMFLPKLDHWVSLHSVNLGTWKNVRWMHARPREATLYHGIDDHAYIDYNWGSLRPLFSLSGYFAMQIAHIMGSNLIVLCGCPGYNSKRFFDATPRSDFAYGADATGSGNGVRKQLEHEMARLPGFKARVRSMSGWTRKFFGGL